MTSIIRTAWTTLTKGRHFVGRDLQGNKYFEYPSVANNFGRPKRLVKYKREMDMYPGVAALPIQWNSWLSHTRVEPPTLQELQADAERQARVKVNAAMIEARDREERARLRAPTEEQEQVDAQTVTSEAPPPPRPDERPSPWLAPGSDEPESWSPRTTLRRGG